MRSRRTRISAATDGAHDTRARHDAMAERAAQAGIPPREPAEDGRPSRTVRSNESGAALLETQRSGALATMVRGGGERRRAPRAGRGVEADLAGEGVGVGEDDPGPDCFAASPRAAGGPARRGRSGGRVSSGRGAGGGCRCRARLNGNAPDRGWRAASGDCRATGIALAVVLPPPSCRPASCRHLFCRPPFFRPPLLPAPSCRPASCRPASCLPASCLPASCRAPSAAWRRSVAGRGSPR